MAKSGYKFNGTKYMTRGVQNEIPLELQTAMWLMISENLKQGLEMDYLQIFNLMPFYQNGVLCQKLVHSQEVPPRSKDLTLDVIDNAVKAKIYVIDDVEHITMLLASEY